MKLKANIYFVIGSKQIIYNILYLICGIFLTLETDSIIHKFV